MLGHSWRNYTETSAVGSDSLPSEREKNIKFLFFSITGGHICLLYMNTESGSESTDSVVFGSGPTTIPETMQSDIPQSQTRREKNEIPI